MDLTPDIADLIDDCVRARRIYLCGNGGSAANAVHIANDLVAVGLRAIALTADVATLTAIANDHGYERVFERQLEVHGERGDLLIALSGSGNSENVLRAIRAAKALAMRSWAVVGFPGGAALDRADRVIVLGEGMQPAEEAQLVVGHAIMLTLKENR